MTVTPAVEGANFAWTLHGHGVTSGAGRQEGHSRHRDLDIIVVDAEGFDHLFVSQFNFAWLSTKLVIYETESMTNADAGAGNASRCRLTASFWGARPV